MNRIGWLAGAIAITIIGIVFKVMDTWISTWWWVLLIIAAVLLVFAIMSQRPYESEIDKQIKEAGRQVKESVIRQFKEYRKQARQAKKLSKK